MKSDGTWLWRVGRREGECAASKLRAEMRVVDRGASVGSLSLGLCAEISTWGMWRASRAIDKVSAVAGRDPARQSAVSKVMIRVSLIGYNMCRNTAWGRKVRYGIA
jgi:hypothetical protein